MEFLIEFNLLWPIKVNILCKSSKNNQKTSSQSTNTNNISKSNGKKKGSETELDRLLLSPASSTDSLNGARSADFNNIGYKIDETKMKLMKTNSLILILIY